ncbi:hypothetical protein [Xanthomonas oryzae]|uniref:hypothetical protein n=1 Tax=Xanthomonas oryzae TaxID=347 RepID=UPI003D03AE81
MKKRFSEEQIIGFLRDGKDLIGMRPRTPCGAASSAACAYTMSAARSCMTGGTSSGCWMRVIPPARFVSMALMPIETLKLA